MSESAPSPLRVAVVGAGPAGIYASDLLIKSGLEVSIDLFERLPVPFGLIRYGVAPDHPRIKGIIASMHSVMEKPQIRLIANTEVGTDITVEELTRFYDAIVFSTGATGDRALNIPGEDLPETWGAGEFVGFYDAHPDFPRTWDLSAQSVAVIGVGNVALDVSRVLSKTAEELHVTDIPDNVYEVLKTNQATEVHVFGRRGPAQAKFTPKELKELDEWDSTEVIVDPEDIDYDEASIEARRNSKSQDLVASTLEGYAIRDEQGKPHKLHIHFFEAPVEILGEDGHVVGLKTERTQLNGDGTVSGTGEYRTWPVQAVYHAVGYRSDAVPGVPFDNRLHVIPNDGGRVINPDGTHVAPLYATGWIKRGPVGLIGNTKSDAKVTIGMLVDDWKSGTLTPATERDEDAILSFLTERGVDVTDWEGFKRVEAAEQAAGEAESRERKKLLEWDEMVRVAKGEA